MTKLFDRVMIKNMASLAFIQGANYIIPLITLPYLVRVLTPSGYGRNSFTIAFIQYFVMLTDYGFNLSAVKQISIAQGKPDSISRIFWSVISAKTLLAMAGLGVLTGLILLSQLLSHMHVASFTDRIARDSNFFYIGYLLVLGNIMFPVWLFQGLERMGMTAFGNLAARITAIPLIFVLVHSQADITKALLIQSATPVLAGVFALVLIRRNRLVTWVSPTIGDIRETLKDGFHIFISSVAVNVYTTSNTVILGFIAGDTAVGYFSAVDKIRQASQGLTAPLSQTFYPRICNLIETNRSLAFTTIRRLMYLQGAATLVISIGLFLLSGPLVGLLLSHRYAPAAGDLAWLAWAPFLVGLSNVFGIQTMLPLGMTTQFRNILLTSGILNIILVVPLTLMFADKGVAMTIFFTELFVTVCMSIVLYVKKIPVLWPAAS